MTVNPSTRAMAAGLQPFKPRWPGSLNGEQRSFLARQLTTLSSRLAHSPAVLQTTRAAWWLSWMHLTHSFQPVNKPDAISSSSSEEEAGSTPWTRSWNNTGTLKAISGWFVTVRLTSAAKQVSFGVRGDTHLELTVYGPSGRCIVDIMELVQNLRRSPGCWRPWRMKTAKSGHILWWRKAVRQQRKSDRRNAKHGRENEERTGYRNRWNPGKASWNQRCFRRWILMACQRKYRQNGIQQFLQQQPI